MKTFKNFSNAANHFILTTWNGKLPVDVEYIAKKLNIKIVESDDDITSKILKKDGFIVLEINKFVETNIRKFAIAHCIGHYYLGHLNDDENSLIDSLENFNAAVSDKKESDANNFALEVLIPENILTFLITEKKVTSIFGLADYFKVSSAAVKFRLKYLGWL